MKELSQFYRIENDALINFSGQEFPRIHYSDQLHEQLHFTLKDTHQADFVYQAYNQHLKTLLIADPNKLPIFSTSLLEICLLFGSALQPTASFKP